MPVYLLPIAEGLPVSVDKSIVLVGRHPSCDVVLSQSLKVSRKHCCFVQIGAQILVRDLGSLNGVWLNNQRIDREEIVNIGDEVMIADLAFVVQDLQPSEGDELSDADEDASPMPVESEPVSSQEPVPLKVNAKASVESRLMPSQGSDDILFPADAEWRESDDIIPLADD